MDRKLWSPGSPKRKRIVDRFIPNREGVDLQAAFSVAHTVRQPRSVDSPEQPSDPLDTQVKENRDAHQVYTNLLKSELFGNDVPSNSSSDLSIGHMSPLGHPGSHALGSNSPERSGSSRSLSSLPRSATNLSLNTSPRKKRDTQASNNMLRYSPQKLLRSDSDLSDISLGGGNVASQSGLKPESLDYLMQPKQRQRIIRATPYKVLDAPGIVDDFYLNLIDWGSTGRLAVGLGQRVYIWNASSGSVTQVCDVGSHDTVSSVSWMDSGEHLAVGSTRGYVQIVDTVTAQKLRTMSGHKDRASSLAWNDHILTSGSRDHTILHRDCRIKEHYITKVDAHHGEVCGLKWNSDLQQLASGGNDNKLKIWQGFNGVSSQEPLYEFDEHTSAVKGLAWSPHQRGLLASGGGFLDRKIWFWNTLNGKSVNSVETGSQVCNLQWSPRAKELISSHGSRFSDIVVWKYPTMQPIARLRGHAFRVLHMSLSPDGRSLATGAGDETLRLWSLYDDEKSSKDSSMMDLYRQLR